MASSPEDDVMDTGSGLEDDLFGDEDASEKARELSDRELDSGDDEDRNDRARKHDVDDGEQADREARILEGTLWRQPWPKPYDGEFNELRLPKFLGIDPYPFEPETFEPPASDHHTDTKSATFSALSTATSKMRYRKNAATGKLESNTVVYKWSDGSTTISVGDQHYELQTKPLVPPKENKTYQEVQDSHLYLASPSITSQLLVMIGHMTNQHTVRPNKEIEDDALERLQRSLAAATRGGHKGEDKNGPELITNTQDPELQKKRAEMAEKERMRLQRRRETAAAKADTRGGRGAGGGLRLEDLEGGGRRGPATRKAAPKRPRRRPDYDSDDDRPPGGRNREDDYDKTDDFLASSDEDGEEEPELDDEEEEEMLDDESERDEPKRKKQKQKAEKTDELSDADADAEADLDDDEAPAATQEATGRGRKRNIIEDDDDDE